MISKEIGSWRFRPGVRADAKPGELSARTSGVQIDLLFDRADGIINVCEIKHYNKAFIIDKKYADKLKNKLDTFKEQTNTRKQLFLTMITVHGITRNSYSEDLVSREITLTDLF